MHISTISFGLAALPSGGVLLCPMALTVIDLHRLPGLLPGSQRFSYCYFLHYACPPFPALRRFLFRTHCPYHNPGHIINDLLPFLRRLHHRVIMDDYGAGPVSDFLYYCHLDSSFITTYSLMDCLYSLQFPILAFPVFLSYNVFTGSSQSRVLKKGQSE